MENAPVVDVAVYGVSAFLHVCRTLRRVQRRTSWEVPMLSAQKDLHSNTKPIRNAKALTGEAAFAG